MRKTQCINGVWQRVVVLNENSEHVNETEEDEENGEDDEAVDVELRDHPVLPHHLRDHRRRRHVVHLPEVILRQYCKATMFTDNESIDVAIDLLGKLIEIYVKPLVARNIAHVGHCRKAVDLRYR